MKEYSERSPSLLKIKMDFPKLASVEESPDKRSNGSQIQIFTLV